eukprot:CAMPEP_0168555028 /NCGR_PEP_ID=MMETSP0413-20121227/8105_1 /TAXON_ID=136452 /ORGANISM="Filamoeba nolandi, Strain NC-AS-23-1" /LENGTH=133 /DNA_ID=CAMNT_0008585829 /DNA_START=78 /DNA_END=479 /DNA_ORIENTATION=-
MATQISADEVAKHNKRTDCWVIYRGKVYDVTAFLDQHPGGEEVLLDLAGKDATTDFDDVGHSDEAKGMMSKYYKGDLVGGPVKSTPPPKSGPATGSKPPSGPEAGGSYWVFIVGALLVAIGIGTLFQDKFKFF